ncbi:acyl-CoA dehydrogenase family protein [Sphingopyxis sp. MWB1]|uniref:acyl-CoA dehydrogenase family protein n=1 Tax=Sphingopyxis sp. MWB1 TaxID=1537715 RepID=UPI00051A4736|nr:acyl-CoA dehydrogenase family protein [Sphingopyxis sp. MWB1]
MSDFLDAFEKLLANAAPLHAVRAVEAGADSAAMWDALAASGFLDALVPEGRGGAGLTLAEVQPLWMALGRHAVPLPVGETMIARMLLAIAPEPVEPPQGPIALAVAGKGAALIVPQAQGAAHLLVEAGDGLHLALASGGEATGVAGDVAVRFSFTPGEPVAPSPQGGLRARAAVLRAALIAGAANHLTAMTAAYAGERVQFGKAIGRQQALQQQMAVMAEEAVAARIASELGCAAGCPPPLPAAATAKSVTSRAAAKVAAIAHGVHGAIGISAEYDLQLFTRRLHQWRLADGGERYWNRLLGAARLADGARSVDYVRTAIFPNQD